MSHRHLTFEEVAVELKKLGLYLRRPDAEFDPAGSKYLLENYAGGYELATDSLEAALKFGKARNKTIYFSDDESDNFETSSLSTAKKLARRKASETGKWVKIYIRERGHTELYSTIGPRARSGRTKG